MVVPTATPASTTTSSPNIPPTYRLPKTAKPTHYELYLELDFTTGETFSGITTIHLEVLEPTSQIVLNGSKLDILEATIELGSTKDTASSTHLDQDSQILTINFSQTLAPGTGKLILLYTGQITENAKSLFRSRYTAAGTDEKRFAFATHFEPHFARGTFPCFDEPNLKATFQLSLVVPNNRTGLSNTPLESEEPFEKNPKHYKILKYQATPVMSTYLLAFAIGEFDYLEGNADDGTIVRAYCPIGKKDLATWGLEVGIKSLNFCREYFGIKYALPKLDLLPLEEFSSGNSKLTPLLQTILGAMENWGLIIFRETVLLVDPAQSSTQSKMWAGLVVAHEVSHQWFGNLVTMEWWTDLWLNEGFATFVEFLIISRLYPDFEIWKQFVTDSVVPAFGLDSLDSSHPVEVEIQNVHDVAEIFDDISYAKGSAIIRMLHHYLGDEKFCNGIREYLQKYQFSNATTANLWDVLTETTGEPVNQLMKSWTSQAGFPFIKVVEATQIPETKKRLLTITQEKFCANSKYAFDKSEFQDFAWVVPLTFTKGCKPGEIAHSVLMNGNETRIMDIEITDVEPQDWVKLNSEMAGFYRISYPSEMLATFIPAIESKTMTPLDRYGILDDLSALIKCGEASTVDALKLLQAYKNEDDYTVWCAIDNLISAIHNIIAYTNFEDTFKVFAIKIYEPIKSKLGWEPVPNEPNSTALLRSLIFLRLVRLGHAKTITEAKEIFQQRTTQDIFPDLRPIIYRAVIRDGNEDNFNELIEMYKKSDLLEEKVRILRALGSSSSDNLIQKILKFSLTDEVKPQDIFSILLNMIGSKNGKEKAWKHFKENKEFFKAKFAVGQMFSRFVKAFISSFCTEEMEKDVQKYFTENQFQGIDRSVKQGLESIRNNINWLVRDAQYIQSYLGYV